MRSWIQAVMLVMVWGMAPAAIAATPGLVIIINSQNSLETISEDDVAKIFLGKTKQLPDGTKVVPLDQDSNTEVRYEFYDKVVKKSVSQLNSYWSRLIFTGKGQPPFAVSGDSEVLEFISSNPNMIGYVDASALPEAMDKINVKVLLTVQ